MTTADNRVSTDTRATDSQVAADAGTAASGAPRLTLLFTGLMLSMLLAALNQTVLATALPTIVGELNGVDQMLWVITAYILASTVMMPIYGKLGDLIGPRPLLIGAILVFTAGSVLGGLADSMGLLIAARVVQGLGGGGLIILSQSAIAEVVPARERGKYMGIMGGVFAVASVAGPLLGGWFTEGPGWRWVFWSCLPLGAIALIGAIFFLKLPPRTGRARFDVPGMALLAAATTCLVLFTSWGGTERAWSDPVILALIAGTLIAGAAFVAVERRAAEPILPMHLFRERNFVLTTIAGLFIGVGMFGALGYLPTYLQMVFGVDATASGLLMVPMMGTLLVTSTLAGFAVSRTGRYKWMPIAGSVVLAAGLALLATLTPAVSLWFVCAYIALIGLGLGLSMQILVLIVQNTFPLREVGTATAGNNFFRQVGATLGSGVVGSVFAGRLTSLIADRVPAGGLADAPAGADSLTPQLLGTLPPETRDAVVSSYNDALVPIYLWLAPLALLAAVLLVFVVEVPMATTVDRDAPVGTPAAGPAATRAEAVQDDAEQTLDTEQALDTEQEPAYAVDSADRRADVDDTLAEVRR